MMEIKSAEFITSMADYGPFTGKGLPQIAVAGKSNVGKSTLINCLCRRNKLARTSSTPGKTRLLNVFLLNGNFHLVDLPGYGFAKVDKQEKLRWGKMMQDYFAQAAELKHVLCLVDIRHDPTEDDITMKDPDWCGNPSPDVQYQVYLDYLGILAPILSRKFNEEYEFGTKNISDYYKDMKRNKKENFKNCQPKLYEW